MNKNILSFEEIKKQFEEIRDHEYFNPYFCKICNQIEFLDLLTDEEQKVFGDHRWSKKYLKEVANYEGILEKFLTENGLSYEAQEKWQELKTEKTI